jgi:Tol biopolymer transport system component
VYVVHVATGIQTRLTFAEGLDGFAHWSPDGARIAFISRRHVEGTSQVCVMSADGSAPTRLTIDDGSSPSGWSPDGSRILFLSIRNGQPAQLYAMNADGANQVNLQKDPAWRLVGAQWSLDGSTIAYSAWTPGNAALNPPCSLWTVRPDGTGKVKLLEEADFTFSVGWKP